ncbi:MAG: NUMOD1 domain-containing DNA-binding protein [Aeromonas sobria]
MSRPIPVIATSLSTGEQHTYQSIDEAAEKGGFSARYVGECARGLMKQHAGFTFVPVAGMPSVVKPSPRMIPIAKLCNEGLTYREISDATGLKHATVRKYAKQAESLGLITTKLRA